MAGKKWRREEEELLRRCFANTYTADLVGMLPGRTYRSIAQHAVVMGLRKSDEFKAMLDKVAGENLAKFGVASIFRKGHVSHNKGRSLYDYMPPDKMERIKATQFKPGNVSRNTKPLGSVRLSKDGFYEIKVAHLKVDGKNKNYRALHRVLYEKLYGPIPEKMQVSFLDNNNQNFAHDNLVLRSQRDCMLQNQLRNEMIVKRCFKIKDPEAVKQFIREYPDLIEAKRNLLIQNRKMHERNRENT